MKPERSKLNCFAIVIAVGLGLLLLFFVNPVARKYVFNFNLKYNSKVFEFSRDVAIQDYRAKNLNDSHYDWKVPINFWGIVEDTEGQRIGDATVKLSWNNLSLRGSKMQVLETDRFGKFQLLNKKGKLLNVSVEKAGFRATSNSVLTFEYANPSAENYLRPDVSKPVLFRLRRLNSQASVRFFVIPFLINLRSRETLIDPFSIRFDGPNSISFRLHLENRRPERFEISFANGEVLATNDEFPFLAPVDGYEVSISRYLPSSEIDALAPIKGSFYFRLGKGRVFGVCNYSVSFIDSTQSPNAEIAFVRAIFRINPLGQRELEEPLGSTPQLFSEEFIRLGNVPDFFVTPIPAH